MLATVSIFSKLALFRTFELMLTKNGTSPVYLTKNFELWILLTTLRPTLKFWLIIRYALLKFCNNRNRKKSNVTNHDHAPLTCDN